MVCFLPLASIKGTRDTQKEKISVVVFSPDEMRRSRHDPEKCEAFSEKIMPEQGARRGMFAVRN